MARQSQGQTRQVRRKNGAAKSNRTKRSTTRRKRQSKSSFDRMQARAFNALSRAQQVMSHAVSGDMNEMQREMGQIVTDLENRLDRLNELSKQSATHAADGMNDLVFGAVANLTNRFTKNARAVSDDAASVGGQALRKLSTEIDRRPLLTLAIAAGIGFLAGLARRPDDGK